MTLPPTPQTKAALIEQEEYNSIFNEDGDYVGYRTWGFNVEWETDYGNPPTWAEMTAEYQDATKLCDICSKIDFKELVTPTPPLSRENEVPTTGQEDDSGRKEGGAELSSPSKSADVNILLGTVKDLFDRREICSFCEWAFVFALLSFERTGAPLEGVLRLKKEAQTSFNVPKQASILVDCSELNRVNDGPQFPYVERSLALWRDEPGPRPNAPDQDEQPGKKHFYPFLAMAWLYQGCTSQHPKCAAATKLRKKKEMKTKLFVIDLHDFCIVPAPENCVYAALSYVWGAGADDYDTNMIPSSDVERVAFPERSPLTMIHACNVVKQFGIRYLWVDQVCIPNDCRPTQILEMDTIYRGAELTVIAGVENAASGLPGVGNTNRKRRAPSVLRIGGINLGLELHKHALRALENSVYSSRGWTYQEKVLSPRLLIIMEEDMYYSCLEGDKSEHDCHEKNLIEFTRETFVELGSVLVTAHGRSPFQIYSDCVDEYTGRDLTYPSDIMNGFAGLMSFLGDKYDWTFCWGLPNEHFALALLWTWTLSHDKEAMTRRDGARDTETGKKFPSWSWTGWVGKTDHYGIRPKALLPAEEQEKIGFVGVKWAEGMIDEAKINGVLVLEGECVDMKEDNVKLFKTHPTDQEDVNLKFEAVGDGCSFLAASLLKERETIAKVQGLVVRNCVQERDGDFHERVMRVEIDCAEWMMLTRDTRTIRLV